MTIENVLAAQKTAGIDRSVVSYPYHELREINDPRQQLEAIATHNRYLASLQKHDTISVLASMVPHGGDAFLREFERAVKQDGCKGAMIMSSLQGHYPDDDDAFAFFQLAVDLDVPVFVHPPSIGFGEERAEHLQARLERRPPDGWSNRNIADDRTRHLRKTTEAQIGGEPSGWRHLRNDRPHGLCLQSPG
jgi:predicted TIM-barrel fold metal-dependent hydrolase